MKLEQSFAVQAPLQTTWEALTDVERVAPCLPGAQVTGGEDGVYEGTFSVKLGPTTASYQGSLRMESLDEESRTVTMRAEGRDRRGQGGAKATIVSGMHEEDGGTRVDVVTDFTITGRLARFGRGGMIEDVSNKLMETFASCLQERLSGSSANGAPEGTTPAPPGDGAGGAGETAAVETGDEAPEPSGGGNGQHPADDAPPPPASPPPAPEPFDAGGIVGSVVQDRLKEAAPLLVVALLVGWLLGRRS